MIEGFDRDKCARRNKLAALRGGIETTGALRFLGGGAAALEQFGAADQNRGTLIDHWGEMPKDDDAALTRLNALLPAGKPALQADQVYLQYVEAANSNLIPDRFCFLNSSTLLNIAMGGSRGVAFMNSHRTGGMSAPSELPFGKTFVGRYEQYMDDSGRVYERSLLGFYMLRGIAPNGANGPTSDHLNQMIDGGVLADVSVGLWPGEDGKVICNVCGADYSRCSHYAGSSRNMSEDEMTAARRRGVKRGVATYGLEAWGIGEVSGVFDGAVPGAGFAKAYQALQNGTLTEGEIALMSDLYANLLAA